MFKAAFSGPLLWAVLQAGGTVGGKMSNAVVREYAVVTGADGYRAVVALGEVSPAFEGKAVILATQMDGKTLGPGHDRLVVPGEQRGGRSVRDVVSIAVVQVMLGGD
jgi:DMSO/TMAO reductase YedYZ molybdopterin-dependent catalytic subunit